MAGRPLHPPCDTVEFEEQHQTKVHAWHSPLDCRCPSSRARSAETAFGMGSSWLRVLACGWTLRKWLSWLKCTSVVQLLLLRCFLSLAFRRVQSTSKRRSSYPCWALFRQLQQAGDTGPPGKSCRTAATDSGVVMTWKFCHFPLSIRSNKRDFGVPYFCLRMFFMYYIL